MLPITSTLSAKIGKGKLWVLLLPFFKAIRFRIEGAISGKEIQDQLWEMWSMSSSKKVKGTSKTKKVKDPNTPKRPPSAYLMFLAEMREEMKKDAGGGAQVDNKQFVSSVAEQWKILDSDIKQPFIAKYEALMEEYKVAKENYQKE